MSLISDALKTAQRERSVHSPAGTGEPMLEGFFPYVSSGSPQPIADRSRLLLASLAAVVVLAVAGWFVVPALKSSPRAKPGPSIVLPPRTGAPTRIVQSATPTPSKAAPQGPASGAVTGNPADSSKPAEGAPSESHRPAPGTRPREIAAATSDKRDSVIASPAEPIANVGQREVSRPNYEAEAVTAFNMGDYVTARTRFESAIRFAPTASAYTNYGVTLEKLGDVPGAARAYQAAIGIDGNYFNAWLYRARLYSLSGDVQRAVPLFMRALDIDPTNSDVNADLAELEFRDGAFADARRYAGVAAKSNPGNPRAHYYLAISADTLKDRDGARQAFEDYLRTVGDKNNDQSVGYARARLQALKSKP